MRKLAPFLLLSVGLVIGLWLGFNPQAHKQIEQAWNQAKTTMVQESSKVGTSAANSPAAKSGPQLPPTASKAWKQITTAFESFWQSVQKLWLNVAARIGTTK